MAKIQGTLLYGAELTWKGEKGVWEGGYQVAIKCMGRAALGAYQ